MPRHNIYRDGRVHVCDRMCDTCIFRPGNLMHLREGRVEQMVGEAERGGQAIVCHKTLNGDNACCRGFFDKHKTALLQIAERMEVIQYVRP